jgi:hypothetical protein
LLVAEKRSRQSNSSRSPRLPSTHARTPDSVIARLATALVILSTAIFRGWWLFFHQIHHSPSRIELVMSFYKHPIEILSDAILSAVVLYPLLGSSLMGLFWYNFFAGTGASREVANQQTVRRPFGECIPAPRRRAAWFRGNSPTRKPVRVLKYWAVTFIATPKRSHRSHSRKTIYARHHVHGCRHGEMARRAARPLSRQLQYSRHQLARVTSPREAA